MSDDVLGIRRPCDPVEVGNFGDSHPFGIRLIRADLEFTIVLAGPSLAIGGELPVIVLNYGGGIWGVGEGVGLSVPVIGFALASESDRVSVHAGDLDWESVGGCFAARFEVKRGGELFVIEEVGFGFGFDGELGEPVGVGGEFAAVIELVIVKPGEGEVPVEDLAGFLVAE